jgi:hypothetical protein
MASGWGFTRAGIGKLTVGSRNDRTGPFEQAVERATPYWNTHKHPFVWGRRRRHRIPRHLGPAALPNLILIQRMKHLARVWPIELG